MKTGIFFHHVKQAAARRGVSLDEMLEEVKARGIDSLEMDMDDAETMDETAALLKRHGLKGANVCVNYDWGNDPSDMLNDVQIRMAHAFGADKIMPIPGLFSGDEARHAAELDNMLEGMARLARQAKQEGLQICIEDYDNARSPIATASGMRFFLDRIEDLGVAFDTGNFRFVCEDVLAAFDLLKDRIIHVHLKDRADDFRPGKAKKRTDGVPMYPCAVGDGDLPLRQMIRALEQNGYQGIYTLEFYDVADYDKALKDSVQYLKQCMKG